jgi:hypothetical protein
VVVTAYCFVRARAVAWLLVHLHCHCRTGGYAAFSGFPRCAGVAGDGVRGHILYGRIGRWQASTGGTVLWASVFLFSYCF